MNLLITGAWSSAEKHITEIELLGHEIKFLKEEKDPMPFVYEWVEGIVCNALFLYHPIERFPNLKFIQLTSAGFDRVPMDYVKEKGIVIKNACGIYGIPIAETVLSGVLQLYRQSRFFQGNQKKHIWRKKQDLLELANKTVCIVGCGNVGTECAKRFAAFSCNVIGVDKQEISSSYYHKIYPLAEIKNIVSISDIVIISIPLLDETINLFDSEMFASMKPQSILVNVARGSIVNTNSLIKALNNKLYGAVLDVFGNEPLNTDSVLWDMENVIITPHNSYVGEGNEKRLYDVVISNLRDNK